jgi:hypothetical protein
MPQETNRTGVKGIGLVFIVCPICLVGITVLSVFWQLGSWTNVLYLAQFTLLVIVLGIIGGMLAESCIGREKGLLANLAGIVSILVLLGCSAIIFYVFTITTPKNLNAWGKTVEMFSLSIGGGAAMMGNYIARRYMKRVKS